MYFIHILYIIYTYFTHILFLVMYIYRIIQILHIIIELSSSLPFSICFAFLFRNFLLLFLSKCGRGVTRRGRVFHSAEGQPIRDVDPSLRCSKTQELSAEGPMRAHGTSPCHLNVY